MSRFRDGACPLALRASQAAAMLGVSESQLRQWVGGRQGAQALPSPQKCRSVRCANARKRLGPDEGRGGSFAIPT